MANSVLFVLCSKWIHNRCVRVKRMARKCSKICFAGSVNALLESQWSRGKSYMTKWKLQGNLHIHKTGYVQVEDVRLLCLPEQDVGWLSLGNVLNYYMARGFFLM